MNDNRTRSAKFLTVGFYWAAWLFSYAIRYALGIVAPALMQAYHIPPKTMGYILSGWTWSYTAGILVMGPLVDRFGAWIVTGAGSVLWGLSTAVLPLAGGPSSLFLIRLLFGFGHSVLIAATATSISREFGGKERARAVSVAYSGNQVGLAAGATVAAFILAQAGWTAVFYCMGGTSLLFTLAWFAFYPDKRIGTIAAQPGASRPWNSWLALFTHRSTWGIALGQMGYLYALGVFVSWLPGYLVLERKMTLLKSGMVSALPFWAGIFATLAGGWLADHLVKRGVSTTRSRKGIIGTGLIAATVFVSGAALVQQAWLSVALITLCVVCLRMTTGSVNALPIDLAVRSAVGALSSIQNFFGNIGAVAAPIVTGYLVSSTGSFTIALGVAGAMAAVGAAAYLFLLGDFAPNQLGIQPHHLSDSSLPGSTRITS
jgi:MFS transporter, ACS family, D-galactonate transporter